MLCTILLLFPPRAVLHSQYACPHIVIISNVDNMLIATVVHGPQVFLATSREPQLLAESRQTL